MGGPAKRAGEPDYLGDAAVEACARGEAVGDE